MGMQLFTAVMTFLFAGRTLLFLLGLLIGGMLTVSSETVFGAMDATVGFWVFVLGAIFGGAS